MLSSSFDISEFIRKVEGHSDQKIILMADEEATAAERYLYRHQGCRNAGRNSEECVNIRKYVSLLKDFVLYIRHGVLTRLARELDLTLPDTLERHCH
jgi:hypothetical protein